MGECLLGLFRQAWSNIRISRSGVRSIWQGQVGQSREFAELTRPLGCCGRFVALLKAPRQEHFPMFEVRLE